MLPEWVRQKCPEISATHREAALARQAQLTKPAGSLGRLEHLACELAGLQQTERPRATTVPIIIFAGDHGVVAQGVSAYPQEVTIAIVQRFPRARRRLALECKGRRELDCKTHPSSRDESRP